MSQSIFVQIDFHFCNFFKFHLNLIFYTRSVSSRHSHVRLCFEPLGVESSSWMAESGSGTSDGLRPVFWATTTTIQQGNEFNDGRHWRLFEKTSAWIFDGRPFASDSEILHVVRPVCWRRRNCGRRSSTSHAVGQSGFRPHSASGRRYFHRKLPTHRVSFIYIIGQTLNKRSAWE